ncbi:hypothetical protein DFJ74DRAFT_661458 [Hyaloraphidium curvatum]|nr:hypothetical protein DFJ74DRAFT_661458 [Hyaloraphidium curvatum]
MEAQEQERVEEPGPAPPTKAARAERDDSPPDPRQLFDASELVLYSLFLAFLVGLNTTDRGRQVYASFAARFPDREERAKAMYFGMLPTAFAAVFWGFGGALSLVDLFRGPASVFGFRVQKDRDPPSALKLVKTVAFVMASQATIGVVLREIYWRIWKRRGGVKTINRIPGALESLKQFFFLEITTQFGFYWAHRLLHTKLLYKYVHKMHHENPAPFVYASIYAHPVEQIMANSMPIGIPAALYPVHPSVLSVYNLWRLFEAFTAHAGYNLPLFPNTTFHDFHHRYFKDNYGMNAGGILVDYLFGTCNPYLKWIARYRANRHWLTRRKIDPRLPDPDEPEDIEQI